MNEIFIKNFEDIRGRSVNLWNCIPEEYLKWQHNVESFSLIGLVRHVLEQEYLLFKAITNQGKLDRKNSPWNGKPYNSIADELEFAQPYREAFIAMISTLSNTELMEMKIDGVSPKSLTAHLNLMAYHESIHTGEMIHNLTILGLKWSLN